MSHEDNTNRAYNLADEWISIILSTNPELLVAKVNPTTPSDDGLTTTFNFNNAVFRARALAEFRQQLANSLSAQHFTPPDSIG